MIPSKTEGAASRPHERAQPDGPSTDLPRTGWPYGMSPVASGAARRRSLTRRPGSCPPPTTCSPSPRCCYERAYEDCLQVLSPNHPHTLIARKSLFGDDPSPWVWGFGWLAASGPLSQGPRRSRASRVPPGGRTAIRADSPGRAPRIVNRTILDMIISGSGPGPVLPGVKGVANPACPATGTGTVSSTARVAIESTR